jgi:molybdate transport system ATP-binding protein
VARPLVQAARVVSLEVTAQQRLGAFSLDVKADIGAGLTALVGRSGAGKTSLLNIIAGLVRPTAGSVVLDGETLSNTATGTWVPPHRRRIGYVFQEPRLFPHLRVRGNLLYAHQSATSSLHFDEVVSLLNLSTLLGRSPSTLSGGEQQRVALGRALLSSPRLLLLDEPLASIDQPHRETILPYLDRVRVDHALPTVFVTHAWDEVSGRADRVIELDHGRVTFAGRVEDRPTPVAR